MRRATGLRDGCRCAAATVQCRRLSSTAASGSGAASAGAAAKPPQLTDAASALKYCQQLTTYGLSGILPITPVPSAPPIPASVRLTLRLPRPALLQQV